MKDFNVKIPPSLMWPVVLLVGIGVGYTARELHQPMQVAFVQSEPQKPQHKIYPIISVCFTPGKGCQSQIINQINKAKQSILVQAYSFTDQEIAKALANAAKRGISVKILLDKSNIKNMRSAKDILFQNNIPVRFDAPPGIAHNKIVILDNTVVVSGSYNFSQAAYKSNTENLLIINNPSLAQKYTQNWLYRWGNSLPMKENLQEKYRKPVSRKPKTPKFACFPSFSKLGISCNASS